MRGREEEGGDVIFLREWEKKEEGRLLVQRVIKK